MVQNEIWKRNNSRDETTEPEQQKSSHSLDYDKDRVKELINLIQCTKKMWVEIQIQKIQKAKMS